MEHIAALMLLIACPDDLSACTEIPAPVVGYETLQECKIDMPFVLTDDAGKAPTVVAKCLEIDPAAEGDLEIVWDVNPAHELIASIDYTTQSGSLVAMSDVKSKSGSYRR